MEEGVSYREYFDAQLRAQQTLNDARLAALQNEFTIYRQTAERALQLAAAELERRQNQMNEFRAEAVKDKEMLMPRNVADLRWEETQKRLAEIDVKFSNNAGRTTAYAAVLAVVIVIVGIAVKFIRVP
jgi:hypothetical protein